MSDWDVIAPISQHTDNVEEEEEQYDFELEEEEDYAYDFDQDEDDDMIDSAYYQGDEEGESSNRPHVQFKQKRQDRVAYRHRTGAGYRKPLLSNDRTIRDGLELYDEGYHSYSDRMQELKFSNIDDLVPNISRRSRDYVAGGGSKIIHITKVKKGTLKKNSEITADDIISKEIDNDIHHYYDHISHELMADGFFVEAKYIQFKEKAVAERARLGIGQSSEMNSLYCFWCFYLREHFDAEMYQEFLTFAREDYSSNSHYGMECFFRFASYGLEIFWNEDVFKDFESEALRTYRRNDLYGMEKLKAFLVNQKYDFPIPVTAEVQAILDKYPTPKSFREMPKQQKQKQQPQPKGNRGRSRRGGQEQKQRQQQQQPKKATPVLQTSAKQQPPPPAQQQGTGRGGKQQRNGRRQQQHPQQQQQRTQATVVRGGWVFGKPQPASVPKDSPIRRATNK
ncbi:la-related protein 1B-like [Histomonas meleagridis]|uniref:la-related protein 1B-like n=1 Tax=Histomonas meleagridis TaxID=135588 RepID=UPI00355AA32F|nr:la-related protein 1B-like [Histomonas meleagridis]KAH0806489.1 la-related protein 1B-like [Histomonas meleagridis]